MVTASLSALLTNGLTLLRIKQIFPFWIYLSPFWILLSSKTATMISLAVQPKQRFNQSGSRCPHSTNEAETVLPPVWPASPWLPPPSQPKRTHYSGRGQTLPVQRITKSISLFCLASLSDVLFFVLHERMSSDDTKNLCVYMVFMWLCSRQHTALGEDMRWNIMSINAFG